MSRSPRLRKRRSSFYPMTADYIARLQAVDGHEPAFDSANDYLIRELVALGGAYWDTMGTMTTLCGKKFAGLLVPLRDGMNVGTNFNFVAGDFNAKTGLQGATGKYIRANATTGGLSLAFGAWLETVGSGTSIMRDGTTISAQGSSWLRYTSRQSKGAGHDNTTAPLDGFYMGSSRMDGNGFTVSINGSESYASAFSNITSQGIMGVFARSDGVDLSTPKMRLYHCGLGLDLTVLRLILTEYVSRINAVTL